MDSNTDKTVKEEKSIFDLQLHETLCVNPDVNVMRVPGGWIYIISTIVTPGNRIMSNVFVPYIRR